MCVVRTSGSDASFAPKEELNKYLAKKYSDWIQSLQSGSHSFCINNRPVKRISLAFNLVLRFQMGDSHSASYDIRLTVCAAPKRLVLTERKTLFQNWFPQTLRNSMIPENVWIVRHFYEANANQIRLWPRMRLARNGVIRLFIIGDRSALRSCFTNVGPSSRYITLTRIPASPVVESRPSLVLEWLADH